jgi:hypothetical protein
MLKKIGYLALIGGALVALPALAQTSGDASFVTNQAIDQWRASKLVGVSVMGAEQKSIGTIEDVLMDHDGNAQTVVIGVGGFLGIGEKAVAVPFKTLHWRTEGRKVAVDTTAPLTGDTAPLTGDTAAPATVKTVKTDPAATEASQGYPDVAILDMTKEQLQHAPNFHYAPAPAQSDLGTLPSPPPAPTSGVQKP